MADAITGLDGLPERALKEGEILMREGTPAERVYVLKEGVVSIRAGGKELYKEGQPGTFLGEISVLLQQDHNATVAAVEPCVLYVVEDLLDFVRSHPEAVLDLSRTLAERLVRMKLLLTEVKDHAKELEEAEEATGRPLGKLRASLAKLDEVNDRAVLRLWRPLGEGYHPSVGKGIKIQKSLTVPRKAPDCCKEK